MGRKQRKAPKIELHPMFRQGNDLLWKKLYGDQEKPADWSWKDAQLPTAASP